MTLAVADLLTRDALKIARLEGTSPRTPRTTSTRSTRGPPRWSGTGRSATTGIEVEFTPAGHIPGASMILYRGEKDVLFTGDLQTTPTHLVGGAEPLECDVLVMESTYSGREHPDRRRDRAAVPRQGR